MPPRTPIHPSGTARPPTRSAGAREWTGLAVLTLPVLLLAIDLTALHLALPHLAADLAPTGAQQLWILDIYGFMIAGFLITMGTLGDRIGRRKLLLTGAAAFGVASVAAAYSTSPEMLIVTRALLGISGAALMPSTLSLIRNMFHVPRQRALAIAVWGAAFSSGAAIGPLAGGALREWFWWGSVFLMGVPIMLLLLIAGPFLLPAYRDPEPGRLDLTSVLLSLAAILPLVYAAKEAASSGWGWPTVTALAAGVLFGWWFIRRQRRLDSPLVDLSLFRNRPFSVGLASMMLGALSMGAFVFLFAQYLQLIHGLTPLQSGLWMVPFAAASVVASMSTPAIGARLGTPNTVSLGLALSAIGFAVLALVSADSPLALIVTGSMVLAVGLAPLMVLVIDLVISSSPKEKSGSVSSMSETSSELGVAMGIATLGTVVSAVYRQVMAGPLPSGVPPEAADAARDSLPSAVATAQNLPAETADALIFQAREAFMTGITVVGYTGVALLLVLAAVTGLFLRPAKTTGNNENNTLKEKA